MYLEKILSNPSKFRVVIEEINITSEEHKNLCKFYEENNQHTDIRILACLYTSNEFYKSLVKELLYFEHLEYNEKCQVLISFISEHFKINFY